MCDHERLVKERLTEDIDRLAEEIRDAEKSNEVDWLDSQHEVILKKESLLQLRKILERMTVHDKEMVVVRERKAKQNKAKVKYKTAKTSDSTESDDGGKKGEDDEFLMKTMTTRTTTMKMVQATIKDTQAFRYVQVL